MAYQGQQCNLHSEQRASSLRQTQRCLVTCCALGCPLCGGEWGGGRLEAAGRSLQPLGRGGCRWLQSCFPCRNWPCPVSHRLGRRAGVPVLLHLVFLMALRCLLHLPLLVIGPTLVPAGWPLGMRCGRSWGATAANRRGGQGRLSGSCGATIRSCRLAAEGPRRRHVVRARKVHQARRFHAAVLRQWLLLSLFILGVQPLLFPWMCIPLCLEASLLAAHSEAVTEACSGKQFPQFIFIT